MHRMHVCVYCISISHVCIGCIRIACVYTHIACVHHMHVGDSYTHAYHMQHIRPTLPLNDFTFQDVEPKAKSHSARSDVCARCRSRDLFGCILHAWRYPYRMYVHTYCMCAYVYVHCICLYACHMCLYIVYMYMHIVCVYTHIACMCMHMHFL